MSLDSLKAILEFLNENNGIFLVLFSAVVAIATGFYAYLTWRLVSENQKMRQAQTAPKVSIYIQSEEKNISYIDMIIQNIGLGPAYKINFKIEPDFEYEEKKYLSELGVMKKGLNFLAPNQKFQFFLTSMFENFEKKLKISFEVKITYEDSLGKSNEDVYEIDFSHLENLLRMGESPLYEIAKSMKQIVEKLKE